MLDQDVRFELDRVVRVRARALDLTMAMLGNQQGRCGQGDSGEEADSRADELGMGACLARGHGRNVVHRIPKPLRISADPNSPVAGHQHRSGESAKWRNYATAGLWTGRV